MTIVSKRRFGFTSASVYRRKEPHAFKYLSERATFWIAVLSIFAFVTGNMVGQHGWNVFWKSVLGEGSDSMIVFTGMVPPISQIPDYEKWAKLGGNIRTNTFRQVPKDLLVPMPRYIRHGDDLTSDAELRRVYFVEHLGTYANGRGKGSHLGEDISVPEGTPVLSIANGIVFRTGFESGGYGNFVVIKHPNVPDVERRGEKSTIYSVYAHLSASLVQEGMVVQKGDQIGQSGQTGFATAPHLHFQIDLSTAPYHPYWPFTAADQRTAKMSFVQAIDAGLRRENGVLYTLDPMLTVQTYDAFTGPVVASAASSSSSSAPRLSTLEQRKLARLVKMASQSTLVAFSETAPVIAIPAPASSSAASITPVPVPATAGAGTVASIRIAHEGSFSRDRGWKTVTLTLLDSNGNVVTTPNENRKIYLRTAFGSAEFKTATVSLADFKKGTLQTAVLPLADQTLVIQVEPYKSMSGPMRFVR